MLDHDKHPHEHIRELTFFRHPLLDGTQFNKNIPISRQADKPQFSHAHMMSCHLSEILEQTRPPDSQKVDLIEQPFLEGQIDGQKADLANLLIGADQRILHTGY